MASFLDKIGLADVLARIKNAFIAKADTTEVQSVGIDSTPTANSTNLVTSGGVAGALAGKQNTIDASHKLDYSLLSNTPTIPAAQVNSDWNASSGVAQILNKPTIPSNVVQYTAQTLTNAQKAQARENIGAGTYSKPSGGIPASDIASGVIPEQEIFWVEYGVTSTNDIFSAITNNKAIKIKIVNTDTGLTEIYDFIGTGFGGSYNFICSQGYSARMISVTEGSETWTVPYDITIQEYNKVTSLSSSSTDAQYPSAKCVYDEVHPAVASTQPQGGFLPNVEYNLGTLTGSVTFALASAVEDIPNKWYWCFKAGATAPTITWPTGLLWPQPDAEPPTIEANDEVEVEVKNGHIVALVFKPAS